MILTASGAIGLLALAMLQERACRVATRGRAGVPAPAALARVGGTSSGRDRDRDVPAAVARLPGDHARRGGGRRDAAAGGRGDDQRHAYAARAPDRVRPRAVGRRHGLGFNGRPADRKPSDVTRGHVARSRPDPTRPGQMARHRRRAHVGGRRAAVEDGRRRGGRRLDGDGKRGLPRARVHARGSRRLHGRLSRPGARRSARRRGRGQAETGSRGGHARAARRRLGTALGGRPDRAGHPADRGDVLLLDRWPVLRARAGAPAMRRVRWAAPACGR